jgi:hypothetical protein
LEPAFSAGGHSVGDGRDGDGRAIHAEYTMTSAPSQAACAAAGGGLLVEHQRLPTSGARAAHTFVRDGVVCLAIPQLAVDLPGAVAAMNGGDSQTDMPLYRWSDGRFVADGALSVPGGEDATYFKIGDREFLATASIRTGAGPYDLNCYSVIYRREGDDWRPFQQVATFAAKQWHFFTLKGRSFLALAQGVVHDGVVARHSARSCIYEWDGARFVEFQTLEGPWGYNWQYFELDGHAFLAYADHTAPSGLWRWDGASFIPFQELASRGGRAFKLFRTDGKTWLAFANLLGESMLYLWAGGRFTAHQTLSGPGGREFAVVQSSDALYLIQINFIHGTPAAPKTDITSFIYRWQDGHLVKVQEFATFGATDAGVFSADGRAFVAVSNSLSRDIRFREDSVIYRFAG